MEQLYEVLTRPLSGLAKMGGVLYIAAQMGSRNAVFCISNSIIVISEDMWAS